MHREHVADFWVTAATVAGLFVPIWGVLLQPSGLIRLPAYLLVVGLPALAVVVGALIYGYTHNRVLLNRFLIGYAGGLAGTAAITLFFMLGQGMMAMPSVIAALGSGALGRPLDAPETPAVLAAGIVYHFLLNGAAWGAAYALLVGKSPWWHGLLFGFLIWAVLVLSPPFYAWGLTGIGLGALLLVFLLLAHLVYGGIAGWVVYHWVFPEIGMEGVKAVRPEAA